MANAYDVAQAITEELGGTAEKKKLQKLLYYVQGWFVTWNDEPIYDEELRAWPMGPVVYDVWSHHRPFPDGTVSRGSAQNLTPAQRTHVSLIMERYGHLSGAELERLTHNEDPWKDARGNLPASRRSSAVISKASLREWFSSVSFSPESEENAIDDDLIQAVIAGSPGAFGDLVERSTGVRPIDT